MSRSELEDFVRSLGEKRFRADQLWNWMYVRSEENFENMTNISRPLRERLALQAYISSLCLEEEAVSPSSGTRKFLWRLEDGQRIESVYIPETRRHTLCLSTQVGCALGCRFCATGTLGFTRNLAVHEIINQVTGASGHIGRKPTNLVLMGMGEPFLNYDNVIKALYILNDQDGLAFSHRRITISTAGLVDQLRRYTRESHPFKLAISLHATTEKQRTALMPVNRNSALRDLIGVSREYCRVSGKRLTFEYLLLKGINDKPEDGRRLLSLLSGIPCKVNIIAYNETGTGYASPDEETINTFAESIRPLLAPVTRRLSKGDDIQGGCGQLAACAAAKNLR